MALEWIVIEVFAVAVENLAFVYFLSRRFVSKRDTILPGIAVWLALSAFGLTSVFLGFPIGIYEAAVVVFMLSYLCYSKQGGLLPKVLNLVFLLALFAVTTLIGAGIASVLTNSDVAHTILYQDVTRLLAIIIVKTLQVLSCFVFARKRLSIQAFKRKSTILFSLMIVLLFACLVIIFANVHGFDYNLNRAFLWLSVVLLAILLSALLLHEILTREEANGIRLWTELQRFEMESDHYKEINATHQEIRVWRHEYSNNLIALQMLLEKGSKDDALRFLRTMRPIVDRRAEILNTGNLVLDAVASSKLWFASSQGIEVNIQAVYPESNHVEDNDLCAIVGNLLDNAIEACIHMGDDARKFIDFSLLIRGKNLAISICNSYSGEIIAIGKRYVTNKDAHFHGIGLGHVDSVVSKYNGHVLRKHANGVFETYILIPMLTV
ncbi:MAG: GHKL domain-containing protein [Oscillospiraceae bacterium]|nr:GHKL domain-containing protein [Oscillospiraceae bacterium]